MCIFVVSLCEAGRHQRKGIRKVAKEGHRHVEDDDYRSGWEEAKWCGPPHHAAAYFAQYVSPYNYAPAY